MIKNKFLAVVSLLAVQLLSSEALACLPEMPPVFFVHDAKLHKTFVTNSMSNASRHEILLGKGYKEIVEGEGGFHALRFATDGKRAYIIDSPFTERKVLGARDYTTLRPIAHSDPLETIVYGWGYYQDRFSIYAAMLEHGDITLKSISAHTDQYRLEHGLLIANDKVYAGENELPIKGSDFKRIKFKDEIDFISDGHATYASRRLYHQDVEQPQTWYSKQGWIKLVDFPELHVIGNVLLSNRFCSADYYSYDVIFEAGGQLYLNNKPLISTDADAEMKLKAIIQQLQQLDLYPVQFASNAGIKLRTEEPGDMRSSTLYFDDKAYRLGDIVKP